MAHLLIAGLPGAGKTFFCRWLASEHGYVHVETDRSQTDELVTQLLDPAPCNVKPAAEGLKGRGPDVVLEWGFAPSQLGKVRQVIRSGFDHWWFGGDESAARLAFLDRGDVPEAAFDRQLGHIKRSWERIEPVFDSRTLETVTTAPMSGYRHVPPAELFGLMSATRQVDDRSVCW
jgi:hypothetical protein